MTEPEREALNDAQLVLELSQRIIAGVHGLSDERFRRILVGIIAGASCYEYKFDTRGTANWIDSSLVPHILAIIAEIEAEKRKQK